MDNLLTKQAMEILAKDERVVFMGQLVNCWDCIYGSLKDIPKTKKIELPIMEDVQMGMATGMALEGFVPITIYPRMDFLILAANQLINHLDKIEEMSNGEFKPKVIIRTIVGKKKPLDAGIQHTGDYSKMFKAALKNINVVVIKPNQIISAYKKALRSDKSTLLIER